MQFDLSLRVNRVLSEAQSFLCFGDEKFIFNWEYYFLNVIQSLNEATLALPITATVLTITTAIF